MKRRQAAVSREPVGLDADAVVDTALALIDEEGVAGFTIRALGNRLGVSAPTIYWHVGTKADLLEAVVERVVLAPAEVAPPGMAWDDGLRRFFRLVRERLVGHPNVMELMRSVHSRAFEQWTTEAFVLMREAGFDDEDAARHARLAVAHAIACANFEANAPTTEFMERVPDDATGRRFRVKPEKLRAGLPPEIVLATSYDLDEHVAQMVEIFIDGVSVQLQRSRRVRSASRTRRRRSSSGR